MAAACQLLSGCSQDYSTTTNIEADEDAGTTVDCSPTSVSVRLTLPAGNAAQYILVPTNAISLLVPRTQSADVADVSVVIVREDHTLAAQYSHSIASDSALWTTGVLLPVDGFTVGLSSLIGVANQDVVFETDRCSS
jgi:hypothetical protein